MEWTYTVGNRIVGGLLLLLAEILIAFIWPLPFVLALVIVLLTAAVWLIVLWQTPNLPPKGFQ